MPVPFVACGTGIAPDASRAYSERTSSGAPVLTGVELFERFVRGTLG
jgi:hypothetical protein